jgi:hypothetical protein
MRAMDWFALALHASCAAAAVAFVVARRRGRLRPEWTRAETIIALVLASSMLALTSGPVLIDFIKAYHYAGRAIVSDPTTLYECSRAQCYVNLPAIALLFIPFALMEPYTAALVFSVIGLAALAAAMRLLIRDANRDIVLWLFVLSGPLYYSIRIGNTTHVLLIALIVAFDRLAAGRDRLAGGLLAAAALIKPPLALFLPYLLLRGRYSAALTMGAASAAVIALSLALYGIELHTFWLREFVVDQGASPIAAYNVQSVSGFLAHLLTRGHLRDWYPIPMGGAFRTATLMISGGLVLAVAAVCWRSGRPRSSEDWYAELSLMLTLAVLVAPISWTHYYLLLLIPIAALAGGRRLRLPDGWLAVAVAAAVVLTSVPVVLLSVPGRIPSGLYARVAISHYFYGGLVLLAALTAVRAMAGERIASLPGSTAGAAEIAG